MAGRQKTEYAVALGQALKHWSEGPEGADLETLREELDIDTRSWRDVLSGSRIIESRKSDLYAVLFRRTRLLEADPTNIPDRPGKPRLIRRWTIDNLASWWQSRYPDEFMTRDVQRLLSQTRGAKETNFVYEETEEEESQELREIENALDLIIKGDAETRAAFCRANREILRRISEKMLVLSSQKNVREGVLKLKGVL